MANGIEFGEVVKVRPGAAGSSVTLGVVAERRKTDCRVIDLRSQRSAWVSLRDVAPVAAAPGVASLEFEISGILSLLGATEMEFSMAPGKEARLAASHGAITPGALDTLRSHLGSRLRTCVIRPRGMHRIQTVIEFTPAPEAGPAPP